MSPEITQLTLYLDCIVLPCYTESVSVSLYCICIIKRGGIQGEIKQESGILGELPRAMHDKITAKHQNCHYLELKEELKRTEKNLKELNL